MLPWAGTGQRSVPGAMTDKKLRGGLPNKQRPSGEPSACAKSLSLNLKGPCSCPEGKVKEPLGEEMASQRLLARKGAWELLGQWASATAWVAGTQPRGSDLLVHDGALTTGLFQELPSQFKLQPGLTTCSGHSLCR